MSLTPELRRAIDWVRILRRDALPRVLDRAVKADFERPRGVSMSSSPSHPGICYETLEIFGYLIREYFNNDPDLVTKNNWLYIKADSKNGGMVSANRSGKP